MSYSYASSSLDAASTTFVIITLITIVVLTCCLAAWFMAMAYIAKAAKAKGWDAVGALWFIGLFATPITPALIVAITPDKREGGKPVEDDLPSI